MSANGEIEIAVTAEGADQAAQDLAGDGDGGGGGPPLGGGGGGDGGGGGLRGNLKAGAIAGLLMSLLGPLLDVLNPIMKILQAFLAPLATFLMRLFQPVLQVLLTKVLPMWLSFMRIANRGIPNLISLLMSVPSRIWSFMTALPGLIWGAISSGASWIANGAVAIGSAVWDAVSAGASWIINGASAIGKAVWDFTKGAVNNILSTLSDLPGDIWDFMKRLPTRIANQLKDVIPGAATGGIATAPTLSFVAEEGPEAIIPLDKLEQMMQSQQGGGGTSVSISGGLAPFIQQVERSSQVDL
jgi:hypothetical protein